MTKPVPRVPTTVSHSCGWTRTYDTAGKAERGLREHSCELARVRIERARRVAQRRTSSGVKRDCEHKQARHQHGTHAAFALDRCRCRACRDATTAYNNNRERKIAYGQWQPFVDAGPVREHVLGLVANNLGRRTIAARARVSDKVIGRLVRGENVRLRAEAAARLLAVTYDDRADNALVLAAETWDYVHNLMALGYSRAWVARQIGNGARLQLGKILVTQRQARAVRELAERTLTAAPVSPESGRALNEARRNGWKTLTDLIDLDEDVAC